MTNLPAPAALVWRFVLPLLLTISGMAVTAMSLLNLASARRLEQLTSQQVWFIPPSTAVVIAAVTGTLISGMYMLIPHRMPLRIAAPLGAAGLICGTLALTQLPTLGSTRTLTESAPVHVTFRQVSTGRTLYAATMTAPQAGCVLRALALAPADVSMQADTPAQAQTAFAAGDLLTRSRTLRCQSVPMADLAHAIPGTHTTH